jgi:hypothetical protein
MTVEGIIMLKKDINNCLRTYVLLMTLIVILQ